VSAVDAGDLPAVMTVPEAAAYLGIGRTAAYEAIRRGQLPALRIGRKLRVSRTAVERALLEGGRGAGRPHAHQLLDRERAAAGDHPMSSGPATSANDPDTRHRT
jgi:excisionase family DNA binding protein